MVQGGGTAARREVIIRNLVAGIERTRLIRRPGIKQDVPLFAVMIRFLITGQRWTGPCRPSFPLQLVLMR